MPMTVARFHRVSRVVAIIFPAYSVFEILNKMFLSKKTSQFVFSVTDEQY